MIAFAAGVREARNSTDNSTNNINEFDHALCVEEHHPWIKWFKLASMIFGYALPLLMVMFCYSAVLCRLYKNAANSTLRETNAPDPMLQKVTRIVIVLVMVFALDWLLFHVLRLWRHFGDFKYNQGFYWCEIVGKLLSYTNCCCNPVIYAFVSRSFRQDFKKAMLCRYLKSARERVGNKLAMSLRNNCKDEARCLNITEDRTNYTNPDKTSPFVQPRNEKVCCDHNHLSPHVEQ